MTSLKFSRALLFAAGLLAVAATGPAGAQDPQPENADPSPPPTYDYVQQAGAMSFDGSTLTLSDANTGVLFFSDRPYRLGGQVSNANFAGYWQADDGFKGDPPNAVVSVLSEADKAPALVELTSASVEGASVVYGVKVLRGDLPESATGVALFIDHGPRPHQRATGTVGFEPYGPYCYHSPQDPRCQAWHHPYHPPHHPYYPPHQPYHPPYYHPDAAYAAGVATGAAMANASKPPAYYYYPIPTGPLPANCWINSQHTRMVCSVPLQ
ncbi:hypothetical protein [Roseibium marinum]|uniref:Uncharacterized protein n=1 Tax=Roseibium marinum TaxID=281252 RepID=A0A2S3UX56_9HYPH|nr:hypothetical protein [Roseibium marinum]POF32312.1 hypothetical protein CLV41_103235 [Roseibium marinum]